MSIATLLALPGPGRASDGHDVLPPPRVTCGSCLLVDDLGTELFARAPERVRANASTTKMLTGLAVIESGVSLDDEVRVSEAAAATPEGRLSLEAGERLSVRELLAGLLLTSSNDAAVALAEHVAGTESRFVVTMNALAAELGATDTHFVTAHGLDQPGHETTARDLLAIAQAFMAVEVLAELVGKDTLVISSQQRQVTLETTNELIGSYRGAIGVKTGFTENAGNVLVAAAQRSGRRLMVVVMDSEDHFQDARRLLDHGFELLRRTVLLAADTAFGDIVVDAEGSVGTMALRDVQGIQRPDRVVVTFAPSDGLRAPISAGQEVGVAIVKRRDGTEVGRSPVVATNDVDANTPGPLERALTAMISAVAAVLPGER